MDNDEEYDQYDEYGGIADYRQGRESIPYHEYEQAARETRDGKDTQRTTPSTTSSYEVEQTVAGSADWKPDSRSERSPSYRRRIVLAILSVFIVILAGSSAWLLHIQAKPSAASTRAGRFLSAACPFKPGYGIIAGKNLRCGYLTVPEDRDQPGGNMIQLAVAILKAPGNHTPADPVVYLTGGPGGGLLGDLGEYINSINLVSFTMGHDLILLDQRGTGYSVPALSCPELSGPNADPGGPVVGAKECHDRLLQDNIGLQGYTTIENADDVHDLIHALGYKQVDLYGVSYGTRLALTVMRLFPADIRSVILDSTVPTQFNLFNEEPVDTQHALDTLFHGCAASRACNAAYPHLDQTFYQLVDALNTSPATFQEDQTDQGGQMRDVQFNGDDLVNIVFNVMYDASYIPTLPKMIMQIEAGNYATLAQYAGNISFEHSAGVSDGMYYSVECGEDMAYTTMDNLDSAVYALNPQLQHGIRSALHAEYDICQQWGQKPVPAAQKRPVSSAVLTLILSGEYDPITPPANGLLAAQTLSHSYFYQFPGIGHGVLHTNACPDAIALAFLQAPISRPNGSCIHTMHEPDFELP